MTTLMHGISPPYASIHHGVVLDMAINNGINPFNNEQCSVKTGYLYEMESIEDVKRAYRRVLEHVMKLQVSIDNYVEYIIQYNAPRQGFPYPWRGVWKRGWTPHGADANTTHLAEQQQGLPPLRIHSQP
jgi:formate C-acetyltransferase